MKLKREKTTLDKVAEFVFLIGIAWVLAKFIF